MDQGSARMALLESYHTCISSAHKLEEYGFTIVFSFGLLSLCLWDSNRVRHGWKKIGFHAAWTTTTQMRAVEMNANQQFFFQEDEEQQESSRRFDIEWVGDMTVLETFALGSAESDSAEDGQAPTNTANVVTDSQVENMFDCDDLFRM
ncbi:hypothetical protein R1sor_010047 [Riccia sorocarpa]|uniref:Uncharacterized protein n=1 Tax=Riccia sorocarpa TaxID=122646 RepID=A0ABD3HYB0_9MARC